MAKRKQQNTIYLLENTVPVKTDTIMTELTRDDVDDEVPGVDADLLGVLPDDKFCEYSNTSAYNIFVPLQ